MPMLSTVRHNAGDQYRIAFELELPNPYRAGGVPISLGDLGLAESAQIEHVMIPGPQSGYFFEWNGSQSRLLVLELRSGNLAEVPERTALSHVTVRGYAHGI